MSPYKGLSLKGYIKGIVHLFTSLSLYTQGAKGMNNKKIQLVQIKYFRANVFTWAATQICNRNTEICEERNIV